MIASSSSVERPPAPATGAAPRVSIIMPTYQRATVLTEVVHDVLAQDFSDFELLVLNDGSIDGTDAAMRKITDPRLRYMRPGRLGIPAILNEGFRHVRGEYLIIMHDHDGYARDMLSSFVRVLDKNPNVGFVFSGLVLCDSEGKAEVRRDVHNFPPITPGLRFLREQYLPRVDSCTSVWTLIRRSLLGDHFLDPAVGGAADVELWHRLCTLGDVAYVNRPLVRMRGRDPKSQFFLSEAELLCRILRGKQKYLRYAVDDQARQKALHVWRRAADRAVFSNLYKCFRARNHAARPMIGVLAGEWGGIRARFALGMAETLPRWVNVCMLGALRYAHQVRLKFTSPTKLVDTSVAQTTS